jgi:hypothetical protein
MAKRNTWPIKINFAIRKSWDNMFYILFSCLKYSVYVSYLRFLILTGDIPSCFYNLRYQTKIHIAQSLVIKPSIFIVCCTIQRKISQWGENYELYRNKLGGYLFCERHLFHKNFYCYDLQYCIKVHLT